MEKSKKTKTTVYLTDSAETYLNEVFVKRLLGKNKTDKSTLFCEGIKLLYKQEFASKQMEDITSENQ